jgi:hypothetical protein
MSSLVEAVEAISERVVWGYHRSRGSCGSSPRAKKVDAALRMSFTRRSSLFSRSSSLSRCPASVVSPGQTPPSVSARRTHWRASRGSPAASCRWTRSPSTASGTRLGARTPSSPPPPGTQPGTAAEARASPPTGLRPLTTWSSHRSRAVQPSGLLPLDDSLGCVRDRPERPIYLTARRSGISTNWYTPSSEASWISPGTDGYAPIGRAERRRHDQQEGEDTRAFVRRG